MDRIGRRGAACGAAAGAACQQGPGAAAKKGMREKEVEWRNASATQAGRQEHREILQVEREKEELTLSIGVWRGEGRFSGQSDGETGSAASQAYSFLRTRKSPLSESTSSNLQYVRSSTVLWPPAPPPSNLPRPALRPPSGPSDCFNACTTVLMIFQSPLPPPLHLVLPLCSTFAYNFCFVFFLKKTSQVHKEHCGGLLLQCKLKLLTHGYVILFFAQCSGTATAHFNSPTLVKEINILCLELCTASSGRTKLLKIPGKDVICPHVEKAHAWHFH